ncbi:MAG: hypothetical protein QM538_03475 [Methylacidiphilales bacterium]|nr:hypothetical protein [Candidatus Methylacidiphilales bacterium]
MNNSNNFNPFDDFIEQSDDTTTDTTSKASKYSPDHNTSLMSKIDDIKLNQQLKKSISFLEDEE